MPIDPNAHDPVSHRRHDPVSQSRGAGFLVDFDEVPTGSAGHGTIVWPIYLRCGLPWENAELRFAKRFLKTLRSKKIHPLTQLFISLDNAYRRNWSNRGKIPQASSNDREVFLPARNLLLSVKALLFLSSKGIGDLALATLRGNPFDDATTSYFRDLESVLQRSFKSRVRLHTPFRDLSKIEVIRTYRQLPLEFSLSCINPQGLVHCGRCNKCAERQHAFREAKAPDRTAYRHKPHDASTKI